MWAKIAFQEMGEKKNTFGTKRFRCICASSGVAVRAGHFICPHAVRRFIAAFWRPLIDL